MSATWDSKSLKATPTTDDEVLIIDTEDSRNQKRATLSSIPVNITTSNVGTGNGLALSPVGNDFPFKSLIGTAPIVLIGNANDVTFTLNALTNGDLAVGVFSNITGIGTQTQITVNGFIDLERITIPADPAADTGRFYVKQTDSNNDDLYIKLKQAGTIVEIKLT